MKNRKVFISSVRMDDSKTQVLDIDVKYKESIVRFISDSKFEPRILSKPSRGMSVREPYSIIK